MATKTISLLPCDQFSIRIRSPQGTRATASTPSLSEVRPRDKSTFEGLETLFAIYYNLESERLAKRREVLPVFGCDFVQEIDLQFLILVD